MKLRKYLLVAYMTSLVFGRLPNANASANSGGIIGPWQYTAPLPAPATDFAISRSATHAYLVGGVSSSPAYDALASVAMSTISPSGDLGAWQSVNSLSQRRQNPAAVIAGNFLYALGGYDGQSLTNVEMAAINVDGTLGPWVTTSSLATARFRFTAQAIGSYIYVIGGFGGSGELNSVERALINSNGTLGAWQAAPSLTTGRMELASFVAGNYLFALGGEGQSNGNWITLDSIERAPILPDDSIGSWQNAGSMTVARHSLGAVYTAGDLYVLGGNTGGNSTLFQSSVEKATVSANGVIGPWEPMPSMQAARYSFGTLVADTHLYAIGGISVTTPLSTIERATIIVDTTPPVIDSLAINGGALASTSQDISVTVSASDSESGVGWLSFSNDGSSWSVWAPFAPTSSWRLSPGDGPKTVYVRVKDLAGNLSAATHAAIELDTTVAAEFGLTINNAALFTNNPGVMLTIGARPGTAQIEISNDGGFSGAVWEPYATHRPWTITQFGNYVIPRVVYLRYRNVSNATTAIYQDDIILDVTPPTGSIQVLPGSVRVEPASVIHAWPANGFQIFLPFVTYRYCPGVPSGPPNHMIHLTASDDVSGVGQMLISNYADFTCSWWDSFTTSQAWFVPPGGTLVYVKIVDNAGNVSDPIIGQVH